MSFDESQLIRASARISQRRHQQPLLRVTVGRCQAGRAAILPHCTPVYDKGFRFVASKR